MSLHENVESVMGRCDTLYYDNLGTFYTLRPLRLQDPPRGWKRKSHIQRQDDWRSEVGDESIQLGERFVRVNARREPPRTAARPQKQRRISLPNESESESEITFESPSVFSSRFKADF